MKIHLNAWYQAARRLVQGLRLMWLAGLLALASLSAMAATVLEYKFEQSSYNGTTGEITDTSGSAHHGNIFDAVTSTASGYRCRGLRVPANSDSTSVSATTVVDVNTVGSFGSATFWYRSVDTGSSANRMLFDASGSATQLFYLYRSGTGANAIDLAFTSTDNYGNSETATATNVMSEATWTHIGVTWVHYYDYWYNIGITDLNIYVNGVLQGARTAWPTGYDLSSSITYFRLGDNRAATSPVLNSANGYFDQLRLFDYEMTAAQMAADAANVPTCSTLDHLEVTSASSSAVPGAAVTFTIKACADPNCFSLTTGGVTGSMSITGVTPTYTGGATFSIASGSSTTTKTVSMTSGTAVIGIAATPSPAPTGSPTKYCGLGVTATSSASCNLTVVGVDHMEITTSASTGVTCNPVTFTIKACANVACSSLHTGGSTGTLTVSGTGMTVTPASQTYTIAAGSSSTTVTAQVVTAGTVAAALSSVSPAASTTYYCGMGTAATIAGASNCNYAATSSALLFDVPNHYADVSQSVTVTSIRSSDNAAVCTPGFASVSKSVLFKCTYTNPTTGTLPVLVGGSPLNASNSAAAACDTTGRSVSLAFNASGVATTTFQYADVGQMGLTATYTGSGSDAGLTMTGSDSFKAAPYSFAVSSVTAGNLTAGSAFSATVAAKNYSGATTPNFGRETSAEGATLSFVRAKPTGTASVNGSYSGTLGSFTSGAASTSNMIWSEVGYGDVAASLTSGSYLSTGMRAAGSSAGSVACAVEGATCTLPTGATATVFFGANGFVNSLASQSGSLACTTAVFGDPIPATAKACSYVVTSGVAPGTTGTAGPFIPHHFDISPAQACGAFTYSGQPFGATITARNASSATTVNYDGSSNTTPNQATTVTLSAVTNGGTGTLSNTAVGASSFTSGVATIAAASTSPTFTFTNKLTGPTSVSLRAVNTHSVSSSGYTEGSAALRSGQLKLSNAFGSEKASLSVPVQAQYWSSKAWVLNSADSCTSVPLAAVSRSNYLDYKGASTAAWTTTASAVTIVGGHGTLTLTAPSPAATGSLDVAFNLGATTTDNSCLSTHATTTGANLSWLRSRNGNCAATYDRDPSARSTFGIFSPESEKTFHVRDIL